ncbi:hypothetical protein FRC00_002248 [Tulasnella sp. 408]|nr:hypothetical protein FRC00_002248 [Tulasnella sp. 408]
MKLQDLDPRVFEIDLERKQAKCRACVQRKNQDEYHSTRHSTSKAHINAARAFLEDYTARNKTYSIAQQPQPYQHPPSHSACPQTLRPLARCLDETLDPPYQSVEPPPSLGVAHADSEAARDRTTELFKEILSDLSRGDGLDVELGGELGGLWDTEENPPVDYYEEILRSIGRRAFSTVVAQQEDEVGLGNDESSSRDGIEAGLLDTATGSAASGFGSNSGGTAPWSTSELYLTHLLFSSPRLRFSDAQKEAILSWGREMGAKNVPSISAYEGRVFYMNDIGAAISRDLSNPYIRQAMQFYPEFAHGRASEVWHGTKWLLDAPDDILTPTVRVNALGWQLLYPDSLFYRGPKR